MSRVAPTALFVHICPVLSACSVAHLLAGVGLDWLLFLAQSYIGSIIIAASAGHMPASITIRTVGPLRSERHGYRFPTCVS
jgi:hypothetical protein